MPNALEYLSEVTGAVFILRARYQDNNMRHMCAVAQRAGYTQAKGLTQADNDVKDYYFVTEGLLLLPYVCEQGNHVRSNEAFFPTTWQIRHYNSDPPRCKRTWILKGMGNGAVIGFLAYCYVIRMLT